MAALDQRKPDEHERHRRTIMRRIIIVLGVSLAPLLGLGIVSTSAQDLTQTDRQGPVLVAVTLSKAPTMGTPTEVKVVLDTHSVGLDTVTLERVVTLAPPPGPPSAAEPTGRRAPAKAPAVLAVSWA
jgi:hypothetical protein